MNSKIARILQKAQQAYYTIKPLQARQIYHRIYYRLKDEKKPTLPKARQRAWPSLWQAHPWQSSKQNSDGSYTFLNHNSSPNWDTYPTDNRSHLWMYNLHYLDFLDNNSTTNNINDDLKTIHSWIDKNAYAIGYGWEPYPISLRLVNLIKWHAKQKTIDNKLINSIQEQAYFLSHRVEYHLMANHVFANAKALIFAGTFLAGDTAEIFLNQGLTLLKTELQEQFLPDGGHFERSPMYHSVLLWDLCELLSLAQTSQHSQLQDEISSWMHTLQKGLLWLEAMTHPDKNIAFFNDAAFKIAPTLAQLTQYALKFKINTVKNTSYPKIAYLKNTGFTSIHTQEQNFLVLDWGKIGPSYQPGHAHAGTLSFEFSLFGERLFVNTGTSQYTPGLQRSEQRKTKSHNTVEIAEQDSSEVWSSFRVARRASPYKEILKLSPKTIVFSASHTGYQRIHPQMIHTRTWRLHKNLLEITDEVGGDFPACARFYVHPSVEARKISATHVQLKMQNKKTINMYFTNTINIKITPSTWHPEFGKNAPNRCITASFQNKIKTYIDWTSPSLNKNKTPK